MAISKAFVWGDGGAQLTPEEIARQREVEDSLLQRGVDTSPVGSWAEGLARVANAAAGSFRRGRLIRADRENKAYDTDAFNKITSLLSGGASSAPSGAAAIPLPGGAAEVSAVGPAKIDMTGSQVYGDFINTVKEGGVKNPYALAAIAATGKAESGFSPQNVNRTWDDPSESGQPGRAGGIMSWRGPRYEALAATGDLSPAGQAKFFLSEDPQLIEKLNATKSVEEAQGLMNRAWAFKGYDRPGGESARRMGLAAGFLPEFQRNGAQTQVASLDPSSGMSASGVAAAIQAAAPASGYVDPKVTTDYRQGAPVETAALPPLQSREVSPTPAVASVPPVQVAQAAPAVTAPNGAAIPPEILQVLGDPRVSQRTRGIATLLLQQQQARQQAILEQQLKQTDPKYQIELENLRNPKISPADQARIDIERQKFDFEKGKPTEVGGRLISSDGKVLYEPPRDPLKVGPKETVIDPTGKVLYQPAPGQAVDFNDVSSLRKEIQQLPSYKNLSQALPIYRSMAETAGRSSKASDLNLVYGLGKIMDPTSVVREGEMTMVKNTASWPDWLQGALASLNGGAALTPETRQAIMTEAYGRVRGYDSAFKQDAGQYSGIVERNKFNPADVIPDFGTYEPWKPAGKGDDVPAPQGVDPGVWGVMTPEERRLWQK